MVHPQFDDEEKKRELAAIMLREREKATEKARQKVEATRESYLEAKLAIERSRERLAELQDEYHWRRSVERADWIIRPGDILTIVLDPLLEPRQGGFPVPFRSQDYQEHINLPNGMELQMIGRTVAQIKSGYVDAMRQSGLYSDEELGLLRPDPDEPGRMIPVDPADTRKVRVEVTSFAETELMRPIAPLGEATEGDSAGKLEQAIKLLEEVKTRRD